MPASPDTACPILPTRCRHAPSPPSAARQGLEQRGDPLVDGTQIRVDGCDVGRDQFLQRHLDDPGRAHETPKSPTTSICQLRLSTSLSPAHLRRRLPLCPAIALRRRSAHLERDVEPAGDIGVACRARRRPAASRLLAPRPAPNGIDPAARGGLQHRLDREVPGARTARRWAVYNKAEYAEQRRAMLQHWADLIDE